MLLVYKMHQMPFCRAHAGTSPMLQPIPETSRLRVALEDFHMNPCTSRDVPIGSGSGDGSNSRAGEDVPKGQCSKPKGQKAIADFFMRTPLGQNNGEHCSQSIADVRGAGKQLCCASPAG
jgi:hypothetical protein